MKPLQQWFNEYAESHQNKTNKLLHWFCIPAIFYSIVGLLASIPFPSAIFPLALQPFINWATLIILAAVIFYFVLSWTMALGMLLFSVLCLYVAHYFAQLNMPLWQSSLIIFAVAWVGQFYGHKVEGKKPSFFKDIQFLMIGPAWLMGFIYQKIGIKY